MWAVERRACGLPWASREHKAENKSKYWRMDTLGREIGMNGGMGKRKTPKRDVISCTYCGEEIGELLYSTHHLLSLDAHSFYVLLTMSSWTSCLLCCWKLPGPLCAGQHTVCCRRHLLVIFKCTAMGIHILSASSLLCTYQHYTCHLLDRRFWKLVHISLLL